MNGSPYWIGLPRHEALQGALARRHRTFVMLAVAARSQDACCGVVSVTTPIFDCRVAHTYSN